MKIFYGYLLIMILVGFASMAIDKTFAQKKKDRISEKTLFIIAALGGSFGSVVGMQVFRHKTKHIKFVVGMPLILVLQVALYISISFMLTKN